MSLKLLSAILVAVYSTTTLVTHPFQSAFALRTPSVKCSSAGNEDGIAGELTDQQGDKGPFSVTAACWKEFLALQDNGYRSAPLWDKFALATETVDDVNFLNAVFGRFTEYLPGLVKQGVERSVQRARELLPAMEKAPPKADRKTVNIVAAEDGFTEGPSSIAAPAAAAFNIPAPNAPAQDWQKAIDGVTIKGELEAIKAAFKSCTLSPAERRKVGLSVTGFWVGKGKCPKLPHMPLKETPPAVVPTEAEPTAISDEALASLGVPVKEIKFRKSNKSNDTLILTQASDGQRRLFLIRGSGELIAGGRLFVFSEDFSRFAYYADGKLCRLSFGGTLVTADIMESSEYSRIYDVKPGPKGRYFAVFYREAGVGMVNVYDIESAIASSITHTFRSIGGPTNIIIDDEKREITFTYDDEAKNAKFSILTGEPITSSTVSSVSGEDSSAAAAQVIRQQIKDKQRLVAPGDIRKWLEAAEEIRPPDLTLFDDIQAALDKSSQIPQDGRDGLTKEITEAKARVSRTAAKDELVSEAAKKAAEAAGITLVKGISGKEAALKVAEEAAARLAAEAKDAIEAGPTAESSGEIDILEETGTGTGSSILDLSEYEKPEAKSAKNLVEEAVKAFAKTGNPRQVNELASRYLQLFNDQDYQEQIRVKAQARVKWLERLMEFSKALNADLNKAAENMAEKRSPTESDKTWILKKVWPEFRQLGESTRDGLELNHKNLKGEAYLVEEVGEVIEQKRRLVAHWSKMIEEGKSLASTAATFTQLDEFDAGMKKIFRDMPFMLRYLKGIIGAGRGRLIREQDKKKDELRPLADIARKEYEKLHRLKEEFEQELKALDAAAAMKGIEDSEEKITGYPHLEAAARVAKNYEYREGQRYIYQDKKVSRFFTLFSLRKPLRKVTAKRYTMLKQLGEYRRARKAILDNYKPEDLLLGPKQVAEFRQAVNGLILEEMAPAAAAAYKDDLYTVGHFITAIAKIDNFLGQFWNKLLFVKTIRHIPITNYTIQRIQKEILIKAEGPVDAANWLKQHGIKPVAQTAAAESKFLQAIDSRA